MARTGHPGNYEENPVFQNRSNECFDRSLRDVCLNEQWFKNRIDAKILSEDFRREFNEVRLHSNLGRLTPAEIKR
jgi:putative transposase